VPPAMAATPLIQFQSGPLPVASALVWERRNLVANRIGRARLGGAREAPVSAAELVGFERERLAERVPGPPRADLL
jgi:hypothetical protein